MKWGILQDYFSDLAKRITCELFLPTAYWNAYLTYHYTRQPRCYRPIMFYRHSRFSNARRLARNDCHVPKRVPQYHDLPCISDDEARIRPRVWDHTDQRYYSCLWYGKLSPTSNWTFWPVPHFS